jgi:hypothetical protein
VNRREWLCSLVAAGLAAGCAGSPGPPPGTGAGETVQDFYEALLRQDWRQAYADLHPDSRKRCGADQFTRLARNYRHGVGFEADGVRVRSCEEQDDGAIAHIVLTGQSPAGPRHYNDAITLRRDGDRWWVVLSPLFGRALAR